LNDNQFINEFNNQIKNGVKEFCKWFGEAIQKQIDEHEDIMIINPEQYKKFQRALEILESMGKENDGNNLEIEITPPLQHGLASIEIHMIDAYKDKLMELKELLECVDVFSVEPSVNDTLIVGINVNNILKKVE